MFKNFSIAGIAPFTTIDYPEKLSAVVFLQGCNWNCIYCFNRELRQPESFRLITFDDFETFLDSRKGLLDSIVFSGGEPTLHNGLRNLMLFTKNKGFLIGLHTNGSFPNEINKIIDIVDWIGMDFKATDEKYGEICGAPVNTLKIFSSIDMIVNKSRNYEIRTTYNPSLLSNEDIIKMARTLAGRGVTKYRIQHYKTKNNQEWKELIKKYPKPWIKKETRNTLKELFVDFEERF